MPGMAEVLQAFAVFGIAVMGALACLGFGTLLYLCRPRRRPRHPAYTGEGGDERR